ncbi:MAG: hypothetical protein IAG10_21670 [Planctomycetaceae bacterium]|nr:hypothetical protein [Planctomycetaceae bacterium]
MPMTLTLKRAASLLLPVQALPQTSLPVHQLSAILCNTEAQAVAFAASLASGKTEPVAINLVNQAARGDFSGRYAGRAVIETEKTENHGGSQFRLAGLRAEDGALGWTASWVAPFQGAQLERGI